MALSSHITYGMSNLAQLFLTVWFTTGRLDMHGMENGLVKYRMDVYIGELFSLWNSFLLEPLMRDGWPRQFGFSIGLSKMRL